MDPSASQSSSADIRSVSTIAVLLSLLAVALAAAEKAPCASGAGRSFCYSDITYLWQTRDLASHALPYVHGGIQTNGAIHFVGHELEYPVLTGLMIWIISLPARSQGAFFVANLLALAPFAVISAWFLARLVGRRAYLFAAAPTLVWYSYLNWDLPVVAVTIVAVWAWRRDRMWLAGCLLGVGGCLKLWPAFLLLPLGLGLLQERRHRDLLGVIAAAAGAALVANLPFALVNFGGWRAPFTYQNLRLAAFNTNSVWYFVLGATRPAADINRAADLTCALLFAAVSVKGWTRGRESGTFPFLQTSAAMVIVFIVFGKVHSPQYAMWVLPFFALLRLPRTWWLVFVVSDAVLFARWAIYGFTYHPLVEFAALTFADGTLVALAWAVLNSQTSLLDEPLGAEEAMAALPVPPSL